MKEIEIILEHIAKVDLGIISENKINQNDFYEKFYESIRIISGVYISDLSLLEQGSIIEGGEEARNVRKDKFINKFIGTINEPSTLEFALQGKKERQMELLDGYIFNTISKFYWLNETFEINFLEIINYFFKSKENFKIFSDLITPICSKKSSTLILNFQNKLSQSKLKIVNAESWLIQIEKSQTTPAEQKAQLKRVDAEIQENKKIIDRLRQRIIIINQAIKILEELKKLIKEKFILSEEKIKNLTFSQKIKKTTAEFTPKWLKDLAKKVGINIKNPQVLINFYNETDKSIHDFFEIEEAIEYNFKTRNATYKQILFSYAFSDINLELEKNSLDSFVTISSSTGHSS